MKFASFKREQPSINLSALIDIVFILVIFVVLAANFQRIRGIDVDLPEADATNPSDSEALVVSIPKEGAIEIQGEKVEDDEVQEKLRVLREAFDGIVLMADGDTALSRAVRVLGDARAVGFESVSIASKELDR